MPRKFIDLDEAAKMLGISPETLSEMRERHEISTYRDGGTWKVKLEEVEKLLAERGAGGSSEAAAEFSEVEDHDSILLSEQELGQSEPGTSSTVIGRSKGTGEGDIKIAEPSSVKGSSASDVKLSGEAAGSGLSAKFDALDSLDLDMPAAGSGLLKGSKPGVGSSKAIRLGGESATAKPASDKSSGSHVNIGGSEDDMVLGGASDSDVTHSTGDSGINLIDPKDSGLSLEQHPVLGGSKVESLELGDDDLLLTGESGAHGKAKTDDDFLLTPLEESGGEESDSGSQVIALDSEVEFDETAATLLGPKAGGMLAEDLEAELPAGAPGVGLAGSTLMTAQAPEAPYTFWNLAGLFLCFIALVFTGMMMYDLMRNMWSWQEPYAVNSSMMDGILRWFE